MHSIAEQLNPNCHITAKSRRQTIKYKSVETLGEKIYEAGSLAVTSRSFDLPAAIVARHRRLQLDSLPLRAGIGEANYRSLHEHIAELIGQSLEV